MSEWQYYNGDKLLSRNALFSIVCGERRGGKTFWCMQNFIKHFLKTGKQFVYLRRYKSEIKDKLQILGDMQAIAFPNHEFTYKNGKYLIDGEEFMITRTLSTMTQSKGIPLPNVDRIMFDEFVIPKRQSLHYLSNDVDAFLNLYYTIDADRNETRAVLLGNALDIANPYFVYFGIIPEKGKQFYSYKDGQLAVEIVGNKEHAEYVKKSRFGSLIKDTKFEGMAVDNYFVNADDTFIESKSPKALPHYVITFRDIAFYIWYDKYASTYFITTKQFMGKQVFAITTSDHKIDTLMITRANPIIKQLKFLYCTGYVRFSDIQLKQLFLDMLVYLGFK